MQNAGKGVHIGVRQLLTKSRACSSAKSAAQNVCVFLPGLMETNKFALATTTGRLSKAAPSALDHLTCIQE
jgi:formate dehydrogenase assembly factor FdhD